MKEKPTKKEISKLIDDLQQWEDKIDKATEWHLGEPMHLRNIPDLSPELIAGVRKVTAAFDAGTFPVLEELVEDPGSATRGMRPVLEELVKARGLVP